MRVSSYFYRIVGENENGPNYGSVRKFTTPPPLKAYPPGRSRACSPKA